MVGNHAEAGSTDTMKNRISTAICTTGFSGIVGQMILLRELLIVFSGNEFSIGIILANWLILEAFGSFFVGKRAERTKHPLGLYVVFTILFSCALPAMVYSARLVRIVLGASIGEGIGIVPVLYSSFFILLPVSILHGALFTFGCKVYTTCTAADAAHVGKAYVYEIVGTIAGGIAWTYLLIPYVPTFHAAVGVAAANFLICTMLLLPTAEEGTIMRKAGSAVTALLFAAAVCSLFGGYVQKLHQRSIETQWAPQNLVHYQNSKYSNISVTEKHHQYTFFLDGIPHIMSPVPDILFVEEFVHLPMLSHPDPQHLLFLSGGAGGVIHEALKHPGARTLDYAELDPMILELIREFPTHLTESEMNDERVKVSHMDGRLYLKTTQNRYDIVFVGIREPSDLQTNRFFTHEFFSLADRKLNEAGILAFSIPGSLTYLSDELRDLNASIYHTVRDVFSHVRVIPGDGSNLYLASQSRDISLMNSSVFAQRAFERNLSGELPVPRHIANKLHPGWMTWYADFIEGRSNLINKDFRPIGVYYSISHWNILFTPALRELFARLGTLRIRTLFIVGMPVIFIPVLISRRHKLPGTGIPLSIGTSGFAGMVFDLALIFAFQAMFGYVFSWIGLLVTCFMLGSACGAAAVTVLIRRIRNPEKWYLALELGIICYALVLPFIFLALQPFMDNPVLFSSFRVVILFLTFVSGLIISAQFPLANKLYLSGHPDLSKSVGLLYGSDLLGGWIGGIFGGVVLLPVLGLLGTCMAAVLVKAFSFAVLISRHKKDVP